MPVALREIVQLMLGRVHASGRDHVQQRLPEMGAAAFDEGDVRDAALAERVAEMGDEFEPGRAASDDDDPMQAGWRALSARRSLGQPPPKEEWASRRRSGCPQ